MKPALPLEQLALCGIYKYEEELKTVVHELLACTQPNRHKTFTVLWNAYRKVSSRGRRMQIRYSQGVRGEITENDRPPFWFYGESIRSSVFNNTATIQHRTQLVGTVVNGAHSSGSSPKAGCHC